LLGIDSGLTVTKAVVFADDGSVVATASRRIPQIKPQPHHVERDMDAHWRATSDAIREVVSTPEVRRQGIAGIGVSGHGDGLYLLDGDKQPLGNAIISLDSRAKAILAAWMTSGLSAAALELTGQYPFEAAPSVLLAWLKQNEPDRYHAIGTILACKDWLRYKLTGEIATDFTEASVSFTDCRSQAYSAEALRLFGHAGLESALPRVLSPFESAGTLGDEIAGELGLTAGTPVAAGLHDVVASALGMGCAEAGQLSIIAGTYSINECVRLAPQQSKYWLCRNGMRPGEWNLMSISPSSSSNIDWFIEQYCRDALERAQRSGGSPFDVLQPELDEAANDQSDVIYHPFLYGSPFGSEPSGSFLGLRAWHKRGHLLRAVAEGVVFNHRTHIDWLDPEHKVDTVRLSGGSARNAYFCQLFADVLDRKVEVAQANETGALGAAICASLAIGRHPDLRAAKEALIGRPRLFKPDPAAVSRLAQRYGRYRDSVAMLWPAAVS